MKTRKYEVAELADRTSFAVNEVTLLDGVPVDGSERTMATLRAPSTRGDAEAHAWGMQRIYDGLRERLNG